MKHTHIEIVTKISQLVDLGVMPKTQKLQSEFFGVHETTLNNWLVGITDFPSYVGIILEQLAEINSLQAKQQVLEGHVFIAEHKGEFLLVDLCPVDGELSTHIIATCENLDHAELLRDSINK